ncbi:MAG: hypothetical protein FJ290_21885 [Planctomycetes bacterium]|nr:hypothetical protein [Planctomycetota bacterium]
MTWLHPLGLLALLAVPVLIALSLWRWRRREVVVSSLLLWRDVATAWRQAPHARRRRQADPLLLLRVAVALALTAALCGPVWLSPSRATRRLIIVLDRSASMAALRPDGATRWRACRDELLKLLVRLDPADRVEVLALPPPGGTAGLPSRGPAPATQDTAGQASRATGAELDPREAASVLLGIEPSEAALVPEELVRAATGAARSRPEARVVVATDAPLAGLPAGVGVLATGTALGNLGVTAFAARPRSDGRTEVLVGIANASDQPASAAVFLLGDGRPLAQQRTTVPAGAAQPVVFDAALGTVATLEAYLGGSDALEADDRAWLARAASRLRVAWVGDENYYLRRALAVQDGVELADLSEPPPEAVPRGFDLAIYYHAVPRGSPLPAMGAARGNIVVVAPAAPVGGLRVGPRAEAGPANIVARRDPLLAVVQLEGVALGPVPRVEPPAGFQPLVTAGGVPVLGRWREGGATITYVGIDPAASDWPLQPSFPIFWANVVAAATGRAPEAATLQCVRPGEWVPLPGDGEFTIEEPDGTRRTLAGAAFRPERTGLYRIRRGGEARSIAVSLLSEGETLATGSEARLASDLLAGPGEEPAGLAIAWRLGDGLALLALGLVLLHGALATRRGG